MHGEAVGIGAIVAAKSELCACYALSSRVVLGFSRALLQAFAPHRHRESGGDHYGDAARPERNG